MRIAFLGLGKMGSHMATNLSKKFAVTAFDVRSDAMQALDGGPVQAARTAEEAATGADVLLTMLPGPEEVELAVPAAAAALAPGSLWIDMSTSSLEAMTRVQAQAPALRALDAPVTGGVPGARDASLQIFVGGQADDVERARPVFDVLGNPERVLHVGPQGSGYLVKLCINLGFFLNALSTAEVLTLGVKGGVDLDVLYNALAGSGATSAALENDFANNVFQGDYKEYFRLALALKDIRLAVDAGRKYGVPLEISALVEQIQRRALATYGDGGQLLAVRNLEEISGISLRR